MSAEHNKALVRHCFAELDKANLDVLDEVCAPDYVAHFPGMPGPMSREAIKPVWGAFFAAFPDLTHSIEDLFAEGDNVAIRMAIRGTHRGEFQGIPPTGKTITLASINIMRCAGGKIVEQRIEYDALGMLRQLGVIPAPEQTTA
jgi:steroid delta-isomerase-like uncharacterized protein